MNLLLMKTLDVSATQNSRSNCSRNRNVTFRVTQRPLDLLMVGRLNGTTEDSSRRRKPVVVVVNLKSDGVQERFF